MVRLDALAEAVVDITAAINMKSIISKEEYSYRINNL